MSQPVVAGAQLTCSFGVAPAAMVVAPLNRVMVGGAPAATISDNLPMVNILPFGMCTTLSNPQVAAATASALGVLTPMPCIPVIPAPWTPGSPTVQIAGQPTLNATSMATCAYGGMIRPVTPGQFTTTCP